MRSGKSAGGRGTTCDVHGVREGIVLGVLSVAEPQGKGSMSPVLEASPCPSPSSSSWGAGGWSAGVGSIR